MTPTPANRCRVLTPPGAGAIGVIRVEGPDVRAILHSLLRQPHARPKDAGAPQRDHAPQRQRSRFPQDDQLVYGLLEAGGETLDDVMVSQAPDTAVSAYDICTHGGVRVMERIIEALECRGVLLAGDPSDGEPLWRAVNLIEREADEALMRAKTARAVRFIAGQRARLSASLCAIADQCVDAPADAHRALEGLRDSYRRASFLIDGALVVLVGPPNSGKSTLFNYLVGRQAALVSPWAGTTRDWVSADIELDGVPVALVDTAGEHAAAGSLEKLAIAMGRDAGERADVRVMVLDGSLGLPEEIRSLAATDRGGPALLIVSNRRDGEAWGADDLSAAIGRPVHRLCRVVARSGDGVADLIRQLLRLLGFADGQESAALFSRRQFELVEAILSDFPRTGTEARRTILERLLQTDTTPGQMLPR